MNKFTWALALLIPAICTPRHMQAQAFNVGDNVVALGVGIGGHYRAFGSYSQVSPAWSLQYEMGATELGPGVLGVGGFLGYKTLGYRSRVPGTIWIPGYEYDYRWTYLIIGVRGAWHYNEWHGLPELDTYGGLMLSYNNINFRDRTSYPAEVGRSYSSGSGGLALTAFVGARYYFTPALGAQLELGYGVSVVSLGLAFKF